jgi:hypothetical protein
LLFFIAVGAGQRGVCASAAPRRVFLAFVGEASIVRPRVLPHPLRKKPLFGLAALAIAIARPAPAEAFSPYLSVPYPEVAEATPSYRYANMTDAEAFDELDRRKIVYTKLASVPGVRAPVRLTSRLHGVYIHSSLPPDQRVTSIFEILDARLLLALDDFAAVLERHDIDEVVHFTMYRPNVAAPDHAVDEEPQASKPAGRARATQGKLSAATPAKPLPARAPQGAAPVKPASKATAPRPTPSLGPKGTIEGGKGGQATASNLKQKPSSPDIPKPEGVVIRVSKKPQSAPSPAAAPKGKGSAPAPSAPGKQPPGNKPRGTVIAHRDPAPSGLHKTTWAPPGTRHPAGLAIDVGLLHKKDGRWLSVARHFQGHIGDKTCGEGAQVPENPDARELRALVCEPGDQGVFTYVLTPNYNAAHADHYHMEIKPGVRWFLYH